MIRLRFASPLRATSAACLSALLLCACPGETPDDGGSPDDDAGQALDAGEEEEDAGEPAGPPPDAGAVDAGAPDAGSGGEDAGEVDAGPADAGAVDAGPADAGVVDAGPADAGVVDAGPADAGAVDAGVADAGVIDAGPADAGAVDAGPGPVDAGPPPLCSGFRPDLSTITTQTEGVAIGRDGTIYYSQSNAVGRVLPGGVPENNWVTVGGTTNWGIALNNTNDTLYLGSAGNGLWAVSTSGPPNPTQIATGSINGVAVHPSDGSVYFTDFSAGEVRRVVPGQTPTTVADEIAGANGVLFLDASTLLVNSYFDGYVQRLGLLFGTAVSSTRFNSNIALADGLARDADGNVYVTSQSGGRLIRLPPDGSREDVLLSGVGAIANIAFGAGPLSCADLYVTGADGLEIYGNDVNAADEPWQ